MKKEWSRSSEAVADAIMTLQQYYSKGAFAQRQPDFGGAKTDIGTTIISMLEVAESDGASALLVAMLVAMVPAHIRRSWELRTETVVRTFKGWFSAVSTNFSSSL